MTPQADFESEAQDRAEILDETNLTEDGDRIANFDEIPDVFDATSADDDGDDTTFEEDAPVDEELGAARDDQGLDVRREPLSAAASEPGGVPTDADKPSDLEDAEPQDDVDPDADPHVDRQLDKGLKETFPASDPVSINPGAD